MMNTNSMGDSFSWGMGLGGLSMLIFWGLIIFAIVAIVKWLITGREDNTLPHAKTPLEILQQRYARSEINEQEYQQKRRELER